MQRQDIDPARGSRFPTIIDYCPDLRIANVDSLPHGTGSRFLECIRGHAGSLIAKQWRRKIPSHAEIIVRF